MGILFHNFKVLPSKLLNIQFCNETMKVAIIFVLIATVFFVNTSAGPINSGSFTIEENRLSRNGRLGDRKEKLTFIEAKILELSKNINLESGRIDGRSPAQELGEAIIEKFGKKWFVFAMKNDEFYSYYYNVPNELLRITYKGVHWIIFR